MDSIKIRKYKIEDYSEVDRIFLDGVIEIFRNGILRGLRQSSVIIYILVLSLIGLFHSFYYGCIGIFVGLGINSISVYLAHFWYLW